MSWKYRTYAWPNQSAFSTALSNIGWDSETPYNVRILPFGTINSLYYVAAAFYDRDPPNEWISYVTQPPAGMPVYGVNTEVDITNSPLSDAEIADLKSVVASRKAYVANISAVNPFPSTSTDANWGGLAQTLARFDANLNISAANSDLATVLAALPSASDFMSDFHFARSGLLYAIVRRHGSAGTGRLSAGNESAAAGVFWAWANSNPQAVDYIFENDPEVFVGSENHSIMRNLTAYAAAHLCSLNPSYSSLTYSNGDTPSVQFTKWTNRMKKRLNFMGRYGTLCEAFSFVYTKYTLGSIHVFQECSPDADIRNAAKNLLDLWWVVWAHEQVGGNHGGPRSRQSWVNPSENPIAAMPWIYFGIGSMPSGINDNSYSLLACNDYLPPDVVYDLVLDVKGKGHIELVSRQPAGADLSIMDSYSPSEFVYAANISANSASQVRYSYSTNDFAMGSIAAEHVHRNNYLAVSMQNRHNQVAFGSTPRSERVEVQGYAISGSDADSATLAVQDKATMIVAWQESPYSKNSNGYSVRFGADISITEQDPVGKTGWIWAEASTGYAAVRVVGDVGYTWASGPTRILPANNAMVVLQAAGKSDFADLAAFKAAVLDRISVTFNGGVAKVSGGFYGAGTLEFDTSLSSLPKIDGEEIGIHKPIAFRSNYMSGDWGGEKVRVQKGKRSITLEFPS